jgi:hypothetical protein
VGLFGPYVYKSKKGVKWYLHFKEKGKRKLYFFSKDEAGALWSLPPGFEVIENLKTGLPMLKRKSGGFFGRGLPGRKKKGE